VENIGNDIIFASGSNKTASKQCSARDAFAGMVLLDMRVSK